jgi:hypothetical protein
MTNTFGRLVVYSTGTDLRAATEAERDASVEAAKNDGGAGVITVQVEAAWADALYHGAVIVPLDGGLPCYVA